MLLVGAAAAVTLSTSSFAQEAKETVVVTGSRIPVSSNLTSVSPVQTVTAEQFQIKGATDVVDLLNDMPQMFIANTADFTNTNNPLSTPGGITTADLRGLGPTRTMVLVNGRRLGVGDPNTGNPNAAPDLDQIPTHLVERVEVLTGGASSTYGSDAVAGVVNFIMKQDFEGIQIDFQWGANWHDNDNKFARQVEQTMITANTQGPLELPKDSAFDGRNLTASVVMGTNTANGKGNVTGYFTYHSATPVWMKNRDFAACQINIIDGGQPSRIDGAFCSGSSNSNFVQPAFSDTAYSVVGHTLQPRPYAGSSPPSTFNSNAYETLSRQDTRFSGGFFGHYDLTSYAKPYTEMMVMSDRSYQQVAPGAVFSGANALSVDGSGNWYTNCDNPLLSAQQFNVLCGAGSGLGPTDDTAMDLRRRNIEGGPRSSTYDHLSYRGVIGVKGDVTSAWHYDAFGSYYYVLGNQYNGNYMSNQRINRALEVITGPALLPNGSPNPLAGQPECKARYTGVDAACVPYNIWTEGGVTQEQTSYLSTFGTSTGNLTEEILEIDINGDLGVYGIKSPWADEGIGIAFGASNRKTKMYFQGDVAESSNDLVGFSGATVSVNNAINVTEEYGEIRIPIAQHIPFAEELTAEAGIRFSSYSNGRHPTTWKAGVQWAPFADVRFRGSYDVAIRAPSILDAFTPQSVTNTSVVSVDPCAPTEDEVTHVVTPAMRTLAECMRTGVTAAQYGGGLGITQCPSGQCSILQGGNVDLGPEKAKTFSIGMTLTPSLVPGLVASLDYYKIDVYNGIGAIPIDVSLDNCLNTGDAYFCSLVKRTSSGTLYGTTIAGGGYVIGKNMNIGYFNNTGLDLQADYSLGLEEVGLANAGSLGFHLVGTYTISAKTRTLSTEPVYDCAGLFGATCVGPAPTWRHNFRVNWESPWDLNLSLTWRFIGGTGYEKNSTQPKLAGAHDRFNARIPAVSYFDLAVTYQVTPELELRAGMANLLDTDPPIISNLITGTGTPNTYNSYDLLGRSMFMSLTAKL